MRSGWFKTQLPLSERPRCQPDDFVTEHIGCITTLKDSKSLVWPWADLGDSHGWPAETGESISKSRANASGCPDFPLVRERGVEPLRPFGHTDLNRARLPIPPLALKEWRLA